MKKIYVIRHAESEANAAMDLDNPTYYYDAKITEKGEEQAIKAREDLKKIQFDTYICSPLTRTMQTFSIIFPGKKPLLEPLIREQLYHSCDVGRQPNILKKEFPEFDFSNLNKYWWNNDDPINEKKIVKENLANGTHWFFSDFIVRKKDFEQQGRTLNELMERLKNLEKELKSSR